MGGLGPEQFFRYILYMHVVSWETNKTRFSKYTSPQIGENQNCPTWVRSPLPALQWREYLLEITGPSREKKDHLVCKQAIHLICKIWGLFSLSFYFIIIIFNEIQLYGTHENLTEHNIYSPLLTGKAAILEGRGRFTTPH